MPLGALSPAPALVAEDKSSRSRNLYHFVEGQDKDNFIHFREDEVRIYEALFRVHLLEDDESVSAEREGWRFIRRSGLPEHLLHAILDVACGGGGGKSVATPVTRSRETVAGSTGASGSRDDVKSSDAVISGVGGEGGRGGDGGEGGYDAKHDYCGRYISREGWFVMCKLVALHQYYQQHPSHAPYRRGSGEAGTGADAGAGEGGRFVGTVVVTAEELFHYPTGKSPDHEEARGFFRSERLPDFNIAFDKPQATPPQRYDHVTGRRVSGGGWDKVEAEEEGEQQQQRGEGEDEEDEGSVRGVGKKSHGDSRLYMGLEVHIDPNPKEKDEDGPLKSKYMEYTVYTRARNGSLSRPEVVAYRRFSDFDWLHQRLRQVYHGILLPPLPQKRARGNHDPDFVRERIHALTRYMKHLARHPRLIGSFELEVMLCASHGTGRGLQAAKSIMPAAGQLGGLEEATARNSESNVSGHEATERYSTDYGSTDAEADSRSPSPSLTPPLPATAGGGVGGVSGGGGGGVSGVSGGGGSAAVAVGPKGIAGAANGLIARAAYTVTTVTGTGATHASGPVELLGAWWGAAKRAVGVADTTLDGMDRDEEFGRLAAKRMAYNEQVGSAYKSAEALFHQKRKSAHQTWMLGHALVKAGEAAEGLAAAAGGAGGAGAAGRVGGVGDVGGRRSRSVSPVPSNGKIGLSVGLAVSSGSANEAAGGVPSNTDGSDDSVRRANGGGGGNGDGGGRGEGESDKNEQLEHNLASSSTETGRASSTETNQPIDMSASATSSTNTTANKSAGEALTRSSSATGATIAADARMLASASGVGSGVALLAELGSRLERFGVERQSQLDRELDFVEFMRFQNGFAVSEREMVSDRTEAIHKVVRTRNEVENSEQKLQRTKRHNIDDSNKVAVALEILRTAQQQHTNASLRLDAMSSMQYEREIRWCDEERVADMTSHLFEFVKLQREQATLAQNSFRSLLEMVNATDDELKESEQRVMRRVAMSTYEAANQETSSWYHAFVSQPSHVHRTATATTTHANADASANRGCSSSSSSSGGGGGGGGGGADHGDGDFDDGEWEDGGLDEYEFDGDEFLQANNTNHGVSVVPLSPGKGAGRIGGGLGLAQASEARLSETSPASERGLGSSPGRGVVNQAIGIVHGPREDNGVGLGGGGGDRNYAVRMEGTNDEGVDGGALTPKMSKDEEGSWN